MKTHLLKLAITFYGLAVLCCPPALKAQTGSVLNFDGIDDYVSFGTPAPWWNLGSNFTIEMWINPNHSGNQILLYGGYGCITCPQWELSIGPELTCGYGGNTGRINFSTPQNGLRVESDGSVPIGIWTHVAVTYDGDILKMYVNGVIQTTTPPSATRTKATIVNPSYMYLGKDPGCGGRYPYSGSIDEFRVWNTVRTQYEIQSFMGCEVAGNAFGQLNANFHFNQGLAGLNNGAVNSLIDDAGSASGTLISFTRNGSTSNWITPGPFLNGNTLVIPPLVEVNVKGNNTNISNNDLFPSIADHTNFNGVFKRTFVIENLSALGTLNSAVYLTGPNVSDFSVTVQPAPFIPGVGTASFEVTFLTGGTKSATVNINNNDQDEPIYQFAITATAPAASAFNFDGINDGIIIPNPLRYDFTIEYWMKTDQQIAGTPWQWYAGAGIVDAENGGIQDDFGTALCGGGVWGFGVGNSDVSIFSTTKVNTGKWVHVAATRHSGTGEMKLYVNGVLEATGTGNGSYRTPSVLAIGRMLTGVSYFKGEIDNLRLWTHVRTQCELQQYMNCEIPANTLGLAGNYQFTQGIPAGNNTTVTNVYDVSTRENHGYVEGTTALTGPISNWISPGALATDFTTPASSVAVINITGNSNPVVNGAGGVSLSNFTNFGSLSTRTFVVQNTGTGPLHINAVTFTGTAGGEFSVVALPSAPLATGGTGTIVIACTPTVGGVKNAIVKIASTDCSTPQYSFAVQALIPTSEALHFDGNGNVIDCGTDPSLDITTGTWETWVKLDNVANSQRFFYKDLVNGGNQGMFESFFLQSTGRFVAEIKVASVNYSVQSTTSPAANTWYHVAATYDGAALKLYINGVLEGITYPSGGGPMNPGTGNLSLGAAVSLRFFAPTFGTMDEVRLWSVPRTQCEIQQYMNCEISSPMSGLVLNYNLNEGLAGSSNLSFTTVPNMASALNTGTLIGFGLTGATSNWILPGAVAAGYTTSAVITASAGVRGNGNVITQGDTSPSPGDFTDFGAATTRTFVIQNTGTGTLNVGAVTLTGATSGQFSISAQPAGTLATSASSSFVVVFTPTMGGTSSAIVLISTNDCTNPTFSFAIQGTAPLADAIGLDGSNDRIERAVLTTNTSDITLQAKIYWRGAAAGPGQMILYNGNSSTDGFGILKVSNNELEVFYGGQGGQPFHYTLTPNQWVALTAVLKNGMVECYVNGILTNAANIGTPGVPTGSFTIGSNIIGTETFNGLVDEVLVWDKALTQCEIQSILNCEIAGAAPNLLANYHFNQGSPGLNNAGITNVIDASGNNNHMTLRFNSLFGNFENWLSPGGVVAGYTTTTPPLSSFSVTGNGTAVAFGSTVPSTLNGTDLGLSTSGTFSLYNAGSGTLHIGSPYFTGPNAGQFSVTVAPAGSLTTNTTSLTISFTPTNAGISTATVNIPGNDCTHPTFSFVISASVTPASALNFDGIDDHVLTPTLMALAINNSATIEGWFRTSSPNFQELCGMLNIPNGDGFEVQMSGGKFGFNTKFGSSWVNYLWTAGPSFDDGSWHHFAAVVSGNTAKGYVDGQLAGTSTGTAPVSTGALQAAIGVHASMIGFFNGDLDNIRVWNTARTQCELQSYMSAEIPSTAPGLVLNYKFNQGIPSGQNTAVTTLTDAASSIPATLSDFALNGSASNWISPGAVVSGFTTALPPTSSLTVSGNGNPVTHSSTATSTLNFTNFGSAISHSFVITNANTGTLSLDMPFISGVNAAEFSITTLPASTLLTGGGTTTFVIAFTPTAGGIRSATVNLPSNDCTWPLFWYTIQGQAPLAETIHFDNVDDHITVTPGHNLNGQSFTIEFHAKRNSNATNDFVFAQGSVGTNTGLHIGFYDNGLGNPFIFDFWNNNLYVSATDLLPHHWACVYDATVATGANRFIYMDGKLMASDRSAPYVGSGTSYIGTTPWTISDAFDGTVDELRVWSIARTQCEIQSYMNCEIPTTAPGLLSNYHFNQGSPNLDNSTETVLLDAAGSYTGTLNTFALNGLVSNWASPGHVVSGYTTATPPTASISVTGGGNAISIVPAPAATLNLTNFQSSASQTFVIQNSNTGTLNIGMPYLSGVNAGEFSITALPSSSLLTSSATTSLVIAFTPTAGGVRNATVNIHSNDCGKPLFNFNIQGNAPVAQALNFDGASDHISIPNTAAMQFGTSTDLTLEASVQFTANHGGFHGLVVKGGVGGSWSGYQLALVQNKVAAQLNSSSGFLGTGQGLWGTTNLNDGQWHHVAMVVSRSSNTARLYVDGIQEASVTDPAIGGNLSTSDPTYLGAERTLAGYFEGNMDEVRIWNVARSQCEIQSYMRCEIPGSAPGLLANYHFNQGSPNLDNTSENVLLDAAGTFTGTLNSFMLSGAASNWTSPGAVAPGFTTAAVSTASIGLSGNGNAIAVLPAAVSALNLTDFQPLASHTFVIQNTNTGTLNIGKPYLTGPHAAEFTLTMLPVTSSLAATATTSFAVVFTPTTGGTRTATVNIVSSDCGKPIFSFNISGSSPLASALDFDGTDDYVSVTHTPSLMPGSALTLEFWVKPKSFASVQYLISKGISDQANGQYGVYLSGGIPYFNIYESGFHDINTGTALPLGAWSHLAATWDGSRMKLYVNGQLMKESAFIANPLSFNTGDLQIGRLGQPGFMYYSDCVMDEVRIWNLARTQCEIQTYKDCEIPSTAAGLVTNYHFNQGANNLNNSTELSLNDAAGTHTGTLLGFALSGAASNWVSPGAVANNYTVTTPPSAVISLSGNGNAISNNAAPQVSTHTDFGSAATRTFVIQNSNTGTLNISMPLILGPNAAEFSIVAAPSPTLLTAGGTASLIVAFTPTAGGIRSASISLASNDCSKPLFTFAIQGHAPVASALDFDGVNDAISLPPNAAIPIGNSPYTLEAKIKPDVHGTNGIIGWGIFGSGNNNLCNALRLGTGNTLVNYWWANDLIVTTPNLADGNWHHVAATFDGTVRSMYLDGLLVGSDHPTGHNVPSVSNFSIGNTCGGACSTPEYFDGGLDEVRVWNLARTQCELQTYKDCEISGSLPGLVLNYHFNQGSANLDNTAVNTATDASTSAITGTLTGMNLTGASSNWISPGSVVNDYTVTNPPTAVISLFGNSTSISNNSAPLLANHTDFGSTTTRTFVIQNSNSGTLNIGAPYLTGLNASEFFITVLPTPTLLTAGGTASFQVVFTPTASGTRSANISIPSNDCAKPLFTFGIQGAPPVAAALNFDGVDDHINLPNNGVPLGNNDFTVEFWVKPKNAQTFHRWVAWYGAVGSGSMVSFGYDGNNGNKIRVHHFGPDLMATTASLTPNVWTHVAINYKGSSYESDIFINGNYIETLNFGAPLDIQPNPTFQLGIFNSITSYCPEMDLDEFRLWNRTLCAAEIQNNMNCEIATTAPGLVANYHFNQGSANVDNSAVTTLTDASASANTGTLVSFTLAGPNSNWISPGAVTSGSSCTVYLDAEIALSGNGTPIVDGDIIPSLGDNTDFGGVCINASVVHTFSIQNTGTSTLSVNSITLSGADAASFSVGLLSPASPVATSGSATFVVTFTPGSSGVKNATLHISSSDCDESSYDVALTGTCYALPVVGASASNPVICNGFTTTLNGSGASTYTWTGGIPVANGVAFTPSVTLTYTVNGTDALTGCTSTNSAVQTITVHPTPTVAATSPSMSICIGGSTTLTASGADTYTWNPGTLTGSNVSVSPAATETYTLSGTYALSGCTNTNLATITITVNALPTVTATTPNAAICAGAQATLIGTGANTYTWSPLSISGATVNPSPAASTTYSVAGTSTAGCVSTNNATIAITVNPLPTVAITPASTVICAGASASLIAGGADTYTWNPGGITGTTITPSPAATVQYTLTGTSLAGCTNTNLTVQNVSVNPLPNVAANSVSLSICTGGSTTLTATGADTYTWSLGMLTGSNVVVSPAATETYTLSGSYTLSGCTNTNLATITITVHALPTVTATTPNATICAGAQATLIGTGANTYTWSPLSISGATVNPSPAASTTYSLAGTSANGCISTNNATIAITVNPLPTVAITPASTVICAGASASLVAGGATTYTWNPGGITGTTITPSPAATLNYTLTGTSLAGCTNTNLAVQSVSVNALPTVTAGASNPQICTGGTTSLLGSGADTYTWMPGNIPNGSPFPLTSTSSYTVSGSYILSGCTSTNLATITITVHALPTVTATTPNATICAGAQATLVGTGANTYTWNPGGSTGATANPVPASSVTYSLAGTSTAGCISTNNATVAITVNPLPTVAITPASTVICAGASASLVAGGANSYTWNPGGSNAATLTPSPAATINYTLTGTSLAGCTSTNLAAQTVSVNALPTVTAGTTNSLICTSGTTSLKGSGADTYTWMPGNIPDSSPFSPPATGTYTLSGSYTLTGCTSTNLAVQTISVNTSPTLALSAVNTTICAGDSPTLTASNAVTYTWNPGNFTTTVISPTLNSSTVFTLTGSSAAGCLGVNSPTQAITVNPLPAVTASASNASVCAGYSTSLHGGGAVNYSWNGSIINAQSFTPAATADYTVTGTDANNCQNTATITVTVNPIPTVTANITSTFVCAGTSITLSGSGASTYTWTNGITDGVAFAAVQTATYNLSGSSQAGCTSTNAAAVSVTVNALPNLTITASNPVICNGNTVTLNGTGAQTYTWTGGITNNTAFSPTATASYTLTGTDANNCENFLVTTVTVNALPQLIVSSSNSVSCEAETVTLSISGADTYTWNTAETGSTIATSPTVSTAYTIAATSTEGCTTTAIYTQSVSPCDGTLTAFATSVAVSCSGKDNGRISVHASHTYSNAQVQYIWSPATACLGNNCDSIGNLKAGTYSVTVRVTYTLNNILVRSDSVIIGPIEITDLNGPCLIKVFNGITPNGDGINDKMHIENIEEYPLNKVWVYNRWGQLVYEVQGYDNESKSWPMPNESGSLMLNTYFYVIDLGDGSKPVKGWVELLKQ